MQPMKINSGRDVGNIGGSYVEFGEHKIVCFALPCYAMHSMLVLFAP